MRMTSPVNIPQYVVNLTFSVLLASYLLYGFVSLPSGVQQPDVLLWVYAKQKFFMGMSSLGGSLGLGHPASLYRRLEGLINDGRSGDPSVYTKLNITMAQFDGVDVSIYEPINKIRNGPAVIYIQGESWITNHDDGDNHVAAKIADRLEVVLISIKYRLAPEHPFPVPVEDCACATKHFLSHATQFGVDARRVALIGNGAAGGNMAAATALRLRDELFPVPLELQVLVNPALQMFDFNMPSYQQNSYDANLPKYWMVNSWLWYAYGWSGHRQYAQAAYDNMHTSKAAKQGSEASTVRHELLHKKFIHDAYRPTRVDKGEENIWGEMRELIMDPYLAPLMATNVSLLPETYVIASQYDVIRDDAILYARRLEKQGVRTKVAYYEDAIHGHINFYDNLQTAQNMLNDMTDYLARRL